MDQPMTYRNENDRSYPGEYDRPRAEYSRGDRRDKKTKRGDQMLYSTQRSKTRGGESYGRSSGGDRELGERAGPYMDGENRSTEPETRRLDLGRRSNEGLPRERREIGNGTRAGRNGRESFSPIPPLSDSHRTPR